jgi:hypothetical protein
MIHQTNEQFEKFLHEFQPRHPRALPEMGGRQWSRRLTASAAIVLSLAASVWLTLIQPANRTGHISSYRPIPSAVSEKYLTPGNITFLTQLSLNDPSRFDATLNEASRHQLPSFKNGDSTLRVLAKE